MSPAACVAVRCHAVGRRAPHNLRFIRLRAGLP